MRAETKQRKYPPRVLQQVRLDGCRALTHARYDSDRSEIVEIQCVDDRPETDRQFGNQLWYFEGIGVNDQHPPHEIYGVVEYSLQYGLQEIVEDGVFETPGERERFRSLYNREVAPPSWHQPAHRLLVAAIVAVAAATLVMLLLRNLLA